jgi:glutathione synthase/RimK-type ligase-like ATP-grasp enzyme
MEHDIIKEIIPDLKAKLNHIELVLHDPTKDFFDLEELSRKYGDIDYFVVKVGSECSIDLLHFAKLYKIPALHNIDIVLLCKNKVALDQALRKILNNYHQELGKFKIPKSWTQNLFETESFKGWASNKLPIVLKSHYQHDKYNRFNFLVKELNEVEKFCKRYSHFLFYDIYIQKFIECDGIERKIYMVGDKVFGIKRENPIYIYLRDKPENIDVTTINREEMVVSDDMIKLAKILSKELKLKIFGFDLVKPLNEDGYYLIDLNDFPGLRGIRNMKNILINFFEQLFKTSNFRRKSRRAEL